MSSETLARCRPNHAPNQKWLPTANARCAPSLRWTSNRSGSEVHGIWSWYTPWAVAVSGDVHGILGPPLPGEDASEPGEASTDDPARQPNRGLATGHSLLGLWIEQ